MITRFLAALAAACIACAGLAACGKAATPTAAPARTTSPATSPAAVASPAAATAPTTPAASPSPSVASIESAICAAAVPHVSGGDHCAVSYLRTSTVDADWVHATVGLYNSQDQPESDGASVIFNLSTRKLVGPADDGFCAEGTGTPIPGYSSVPANVLTGFGLTPCSSAVATNSPATKTTAPPTLASLAGTWGAHEERLVIGSTGTGQLSYADLTLCPGCSMATAPAGTLAFTLTPVSNDEAAGRVTASSDPKNYTAGEAVQATLTAGSPGQLLNLDIGGHQLTAFCNSTSTGQCGA